MDLFSTVWVRVKRQEKGENSGTILSENTDTPRTYRLTDYKMHRVILSPSNMVYTFVLTFENFLFLLKIIRILIVLQTVYSGTSFLQCKLEISIFIALHFDQTKWSSSYQGPHWGCVGRGYASKKNYLVSWCVFYCH